MRNLPAWSKRLSARDFCLARACVYHPRMHPSSDRQAAWNRYWRQGVLHSLPGSFAGNYDGAIRAFWTRQFAPLDAASRVLDIGTGNGALPALICADCATRMPRVDAIDLASVAPAWPKDAGDACRSALHFHSGVACEALPFDAHSFDLAVSQYGFEYAPREAATRELLRVLKPDGRIALLLHHADSRLALVAREELRLCRWLAQADGLLDRTAALLPFTARAASAEGRTQLQADPAAAHARTRYREAADALDAQAAASAVPDVLLDARNASADLLNATLRSGQAAPAAQQLRDYRQTLHDAALRYAELCECALDENAIGNFAGRLAEGGMVSVDYAPIHHDNGMLMGWTLLAVAAGQR